MIVPKRYLYVLALLVITVLILLGHPTSREQINDYKDYSFEKVSGLINSGLDSAHSLLPWHNDDQKNLSALYMGEKWFYEYDNDLYPPPTIDVAKLRSFAPHNYQGPGRPTLATFFATRNGSMQDPYFLAAQQQLYRILWDPRSMSRFPMTIFVPPFVANQQRDILAAQGAYIREIPLIEWAPGHKVPATIRWRDQFTKLNFWAQTDFSEIMYMDTDAFPLESVDMMIEDIARPQDCVPERLEKKDRVDVDEMCEYMFTAARDQRDVLNAGMLVIKPNLAMHAHLLRGMNRDKKKYDNAMVEQGYLNYVFRRDGPFPGQWVDRSWNAIETTAADANTTHILHEKLWAFYFMGDHFAVHYFNDTWMDMLKLYNSPEFESLRAGDGMARLA